MRNSQLLLLSLLISLNMFGQRFTVTLSDLELTTPISFAVDTVIDSRVNRESIGYIFDKKTKNYTTAFPTAKVDSSIIASLKPLSKTEGEPLLLRINRLFVYQTTIYGKRHISAEVSITFIAKNNQKYLEQFTSTKTIRDEARYGNHVAGLIIQEALDSCLLHYEKRKKAGILSNVPISKKDLNTKFEADQATVKKMPYFIRGLFYTIYDLRDYSIDTKADFYVEFLKSNHKEPQTAKLKFDDKSMRKKDIYAFSNGKSIFVKTGKYYTELTDTSGKFWLNHYDEFATNTQYNAGMIGVGVVGGLVGVGVYAIIAKKPALDNKYILDFERGAVVPADYPEPNMVTSQILFYGSSFLSNNDTITLTIKDTKHIKLGRDQYYIYKSDDKCLPVYVSVSSGGREYYDRISPILLNTAVARCQIIGDKVGIEVLEVSQQNSIKDAIENGTAKQVFE